MESSAELVPFPLLLTPIESNYRACTIPYRFPSDNPRKATPTEISWIDLFRNSIPSFRFLSRFRPDFLFPCRRVFGHGCHRLKPTLSWKHDNCSAFLYYLTAVYTDEAWCFKNAPSFSQIEKATNLWFLSVNKILSCNVAFTYPKLKSAFFCAIWQ